MANVSSESLEFEVAHQGSEELDFSPGYLNGTVGEYGSCGISKVPTDVVSSQDNVQINSDLLQWKPIDSQPLFDPPIEFYLCQEELIDPPYLRHREHMPQRDQIQPPVDEPDDRDLDWEDCSSLASDVEDHVHVTNRSSERLTIPTKYFRDLDDLNARIFENSMFAHYTVNSFSHENADNEPRTSGTFSLDLEDKVSIFLREKYRFELEITYHDFKLKAREDNNPRAPEPEIVGFMQTQLGHGITDVDQSSLVSGANDMLHYIECWSAIARVAKNIKALKAASFCGSFISILVIDKARQDVARLIPIDCNKIEDLASAFDLVFQDFRGRRGFVSESDEYFTPMMLSELSKSILSDLDLNLSPMSVAEEWRCAVHILDMVVLSYAGAHTQPLGASQTRHIHLPGQFIDKHCVTFRRRAFSCIGTFLNREEAWVLEPYDKKAPSEDLSPIYLATNIITFSDIWGPAWKSCAVVEDKARPSTIVRYNVGNGVIIPLSRLLARNEDCPQILEGEVLCHWCPNNYLGENLVKSESARLYLHPDDVLLIGANLRIQYNRSCQSSVQDLTQSLRDSGSLSEFGTLKRRRELDTEVLTMQVGPSYLQLGAQRTYKRRGILWKKALVEEWKHNPEGRNVRLLEYNFGVEVSSCTKNARRQRLINLFGTGTMLSYIRNSSLIWESDECEANFYAALTDPNPKAFRKLYNSHKEWRPDLGKAIQYCLDGLLETGLNENGLELLWVPKKALAQKVNNKP
ncbi:hypothetical protein GLAREA_09278 [Glarea lozoyensis ATCC 20868]|uniref:Uncharacterized protein n=1 Tax=Glarea lozoyensis (strain ATCC 20868 / MF5171) TaxID=1116229 RepID=S3DHD5_GLAL2|nr:uncharacterized protein GLAREA_09278 [Glarea lozoyensis ATCC 20868]EPE37115.1 hypothetical protein GLAREA_09278 [Glarea lozoyensis ATCC 20868]